MIKGFTQQYNATKLLWYEDFPDPRSAIAREKQLKGWRREKKLALIAKMNPRWDDLFELITREYLPIPRPRPSNS